MMLKLDKHNITVTEGEIRTLSIIGNDNSDEIIQDVQWSSSDENIAKIHIIPEVSEGIVLNMMQQGAAVITAEDREGNKAYCNVKVEPMVKVDDYNNLNYYFGDLHSHTSFSDGQGTPETAYEHAKKGGKAEFLVVSDHRKLTNRTWFLTLKHADICTDETFVAIPAFEGKAAGINYIDEYGMQVKNGGEFVYFNTPEAYTYDEIVAKKHYSIASFAHPQEAGWPTEYIWNSFNNFNDITAEGYNLMKLVEVVNETSKYNILHENSYALALDKGWHVSPVGVSDTHCGGWTTKYDCRTVILAPKLTRAYLFDAMRHNRVYATEDTNTILSFKINGKMTGQMLSPETTTYDCDIYIKDPDIHDDNDKIVRVEIISDYGNIIYSKECNSHEVNIKTTINSNTARYFFVKTVNAEGKRTWSSAIWTGRKADSINKDINKGKKIPKQDWKIKYVSSEKDNSALNIFDGDVRKGWETTEPTGKIIIDMGKEYNVTGIGYYRHQVPYENIEELGKLIKNYEYYLSLDGENFGEPIAKGMFKTYGSEKYVSVNKKKSRYLKIKAESILGKSVAIGEIFIYAE